MRWMAAAALLATGCGPGLPEPMDGSGEASGPIVGDVLAFQGERPKNLLVLSIDTTRRDALPLYGGDPELMPFLDQVARQGLSLDQHRSCSHWTYPSVLCAQTGRDNLEAGFIPRLAESTREPRPDDLRGLASWLGDAGYYSVLASGNSWFSAEWNMDLGFSSGLPANTGNATKLMWHALWQLQNARVQGRADRWYMHLHLVEPHAPYDPPEDYLQGLDALPEAPVDLSVKDEHYDIKNDWEDMSPEEQAVLESHLWLRYDAELAYLDDQLSYIWLHLAELGLLQDTLVVLWTDHGEAFWEHGNQTHAYNLNAEENDALAIFWADNIVPTRWTEPTSHIDIAPTILSALGLELPEEITGYPVGQAPSDRPLFALGVGKSGVVQAVVQSDRKLSYRWAGDQKSFYHTDVDPEEQDDLYDPEDAEVLALWELLLPRVEQATELIPEYSALDPGP